MRLSIVDIEEPSRTRKTLESFSTSSWVYWKVEGILLIFLDPVGGLVYYEGYLPEFFYTLKELFKGS